LGFTRLVPCDAAVNIDAGTVVVEGNVEEGIAGIKEKEARMETWRMEEKLGDTPAPGSAEEEGENKGAKTMRRRR